MGEDIGKIFNQDVRDKKTMGYGARHTGNGNHRGMNTPYDFMSKKERKKLNGEVTVSNVYDVMPKEEFLQLPKKEQKIWIEMVMDKKYKRTELGELMGFKSYATWLEILDDLGFPRTKKPTKQETNYSGIRYECHQPFKGSDLAKYLKTLPGNFEGMPIIYEVNISIRGKGRE